MSCEVCAKELPRDFVDDLLTSVVVARPGGFAERLQETIEEGDAVKVSMGAADPITAAPVPVRTPRKGAARKSQVGRLEHRYAPMHMLGDRMRRQSRASASATAAAMAAASATRESQNRDAFGNWKRNTKVRIWMQDDSEWADGKVVKYITATERMHIARQQSGGMAPPKFKRGMYLVRWQVKHSPPQFDEDYVSDGDATVVEA